MTADAPTILATSIGFNSRHRGDHDWDPGPVFDFAAELAAARDEPRLCWLGTAGGDDAGTTAAVYGAFAQTRFRVSHLNLFPMPNVAELHRHLLGQDIVWVGGGSVANLLAVWRVHGLDEILRECWQAGVVLGGVSAGSLCWHVGGTTDSFGPELRPVTDALGLLPYSNGVHHDAEEQRRPLYQRLVGDGLLPMGFATDNGAGLYYRGTELVEAFADRPDAYAYRVEQAAAGEAIETRLPTRLLPGSRPDNPLRPQAAQQPAP